MKIRSRNKRPYSSAFTGTSTSNYDKENKEHKLTFPSPDTTRALFELFYLRQLANQRSTTNNSTSQVTSSLVKCPKPVLWELNSFLMQY